MLSLSEIHPTEAQIGILVKWLNDKELMKYSEQRHKEHTAKSQLAYIHSFTGPDLYMLITFKGALLGSVSARVDPINRVADVGILIGNGYGGRGHGSEAWRQFCDRLAKIGVRKVEGGCMAKNRAMLRIFEKNGMRLEGTRRYHFQTGKNEYDDMVLYGKLA